MLALLTAVCCIVQLQGLRHASDKHLWQSSVAFEPQCLSDDGTHGWLSGPALYNLDVAHVGHGKIYNLSGSVQDPGTYLVHLTHEGGESCEAQASQLPQAVHMLEGARLQTPPETSVCSSTSSAGRWIQRSLVCPGHKLCEVPPVEGLQWVPYDCFYRHFPPAAAQSLLRGKEILMVGDSVMRFLFGGLVRHLDVNHPFAQSGYGAWQSPYMQWLAGPGPPSLFAKRFRNMPLAFRDKDLGTSVALAVLPDGFIRPEEAAGKTPMMTGFKWNGNLSSFLWRKSVWDLAVIQFPLMGSLCRNELPLDEGRVKGALGAWIGRAKELKAAGTRVIFLSLPHHTPMKQHCVTNTKVQSWNALIVPEVRAHGFEILDVSSISSPFYHEFPLSDGVHPHGPMNDFLAQMLLNTV